MKKISNPRVLYIDTFDWNMQNPILHCKFHLSRNPIHYRKFEVPNSITRAQHISQIRLHSVIVVIFLLFVVHFHFLDVNSTREEPITLIPNHFRKSLAKTLKTISTKEKHMSNRFCMQSTQQTLYVNSDYTHCKQLVSRLQSLICRTSIPHKTPPMN